MSSEQNSVYPKTPKILIASDPVGKLNKQIEVTIRDILFGEIDIEIVHSKYQLLTLLSPQDFSFNCIICDVDLPWSSSDYSDAEDGALHNDTIQTLQEKHKLNTAVSIFSSSPLCWLGQVSFVSVFWLSLKTKHILFREGLYMGPAERLHQYRYSH